MRKELRELQHIEHYLSGRLPVMEARNFQDRLTIDPEFRRKVALQKRVYRFIREFARRQLKRELERTHQRLMRRPSFRQRVLGVD